MKKITQKLSILGEYISSFRRLNTLITSSKKLHLAIAFLIFTVLSAGLINLNPYLVNRLIQSLGTSIEMKGFTQELTVFIVLYLATAILVGIVGECIARYRNNFSILIEQYLKQKRIEKVATLNVGVCDNEAFQNAYQRSDRGLHMIDEVFLFQFRVIENTITFVASVLLIGFVEWWYVLFIIISVIPELYVSFKQEKRRYALENDIDPIERQARQAEVAFFVWKLPELISYKCIEFFKERYAVLSGSINEQYVSNNNTVFKEKTIVALFSSIPFILISVHLFYSSVYGAHTIGASIGNLFMVLTALTNLKGSIFSFLEKFADLPVKILRVKDFFALLDTVPTVEETKNPQAIDVCSTPSIRFEHVSFRYPNTERGILTDVSFEVKPGEKIAFVGINGAGKSTIMKLLARLYDPTEGNIYLNGINIKDISFEDLYSILGLARQDHQIHYGLSIAENIFLGDITREKDTARLGELIELLNLREFVETLPDGVDQVIGNWFLKGLELSGGNYQKILLAKLLYKNSPLLVLDEPTSETDSPSDESFFCICYKKFQDSDTCWTPPYHNQSI
jgi:ATP-binding cassette subfamily B protein